MFRTDAEHQAARRHHREVRAECGQYGACQADRRGRQRDAACAEAIDHESADHHQEDVRQTVDRVQRADLRVGEVAARA